MVLPYLKDAHMPSNRLYRIAALAGFACALLLVVNSARRGGLLPDTGFTSSIAPFGALAGLFTLNGLYLVQRAETGVLGLIGYALNGAGLAGAFAIEYVLHFVFRYLPADQITALVNGGTGTAFRVTAIVLILGVLVFGIAMWRARRLPIGAIALYVVGMIPGSLRNVVPEAAYLSGLVVAAMGVAWLSLSLWRLSDREPVPLPTPALA